MPSTTPRTRLALGAAVVAALLVVAAAPSDGQVVDDVDPPSSEASTTTTSTTAPEEETTTTTTSTTTTVADDDDTAEGGSGDGTTDGGEANTDGGEGGEAPADVPRTVPPEAQRIIDAVPRTPPNSTEELHEAVQELVELGLSEEEAIRIGFGRFPVAGVARYSHDWLYPRWGPGFRFHHGTDIVAPFGTPLRAPVDGTVTTSTSELGGLSTKIHLEDGTYFYYAHLSSLVEGFENGMAVETGDIVGYIGTSGNARGGTPHLHFAIYPQGGEPTDPKPILDQFIADALEQLPATIERVRAQRRAAAGDATDRAELAAPRSLLATAVLRPLAARAAPGAVSTELLYQTSANPAGGGLAVAEHQAQALAAGIDWDAVARRSSAEELVADAAAALVSRTLGPLGGVGAGDLAAG